MSYVKNLDINGSSYEIKSVAANNVNDGSGIKTWVGTKAQYDAIVTKDANTLYNITDDTDVTLSLLELLYPVGSLYIATANVSACPLAVLGVGTWQQKAYSTLVTDIDSTAPVVGNGMSLGLTDGSQNGTIYRDASVSVATSGNFGEPVGSSVKSSTITANNISLGITTDPTKSGIEANIASTTISVTIWERIS